MKNVLLIVNAILVVAVGYLFYAHFSSKNHPSTVLSSNNALPAGGFKIAYFEMDSLQNQYILLKEVRSALMTKDQEMGKELSGLENSLRNKYQDLQKKGNTLSQAEIASRQQEIMDLDKNLKNKRQMMEQEMQDESFKKLQDVKKRIEDYLKEYNQSKEYAYIFSNVPDMMYYKDTAYNITADIVKGLNEQYRQKK
ncbi:OmpH family outer membrane protein [Hydrotalea sp.]|uniref:OmpH family outer membrane protein n=1 Tax=Hydrotalea sp. TaxID=2881279 RepID=UPI002605738E|nr:OmpH family outer membrane protein [Hydrotalea sp.]